MEVTLTLQNKLSTKEFTYRRKLKSSLSISSVAKIV